MRQVACKTPVRVLLTGGGSGGPTLPLLALSEEILQQNCDSRFLFLGSKNGPERKMVVQAGIPFVSIPSGKFRRYWCWRNFIDPLFILGGGMMGFVQLLRFRPQVIISAGSTCYFADGCPSRFGQPLNVPCKPCPCFIF